MNVAVIDIGTNTVLLLVAAIDDSGTIETLVYEQRIPRLGRGVDSVRNLAQDSMERVVAVLDEYRQIIARFEVASVVVAGTSAVRDAQNKEAFVALIGMTTGFRLEVLSGEDEAYWTYRGAISGMSVAHAAVLDIGGGSTEITVGNGRAVTHALSLDIGSVRLTERFFKNDPPTPAELQAARDVVRKEIARSCNFPFAGTTLVGVAGTASSLAILDQGLREFSIHAIMNYRLTLHGARKLVDTLSVLSAQQILELTPVMQGRSDIITAGALILLEFMSLNTCEELIVSERGVRYGLAIREWERNHSRQSGATA
jgi:exopolyphosphatase / guanosine-5'-triphosphate,3'-diphosphate pyrophosphatase